jgi:uncharacterized protein
MERYSLERCGHPRRLLVVGAACALLVLALTACRPASAVTVQNTGFSDQTGVAVQGTGRVFVQPDIARINIGVETQAATVAEARDAAGDAMAALRQALLDAGIAERDIKTTWFNIYPQYRYSEREAPQITGYAVNNQVEVTVRRIDDTSTVLDAAIAAGGTAVRVNGVQFTVDNPEQHLDQARTQAVANARARAETLAAAAGVRLGAARSISESQSFMPPMPPYERAFPDAPAAGAPTPLDPGQQELQVFVSVIYDIER